MLGELQRVEYNHIHAQRRSSETVGQAIAKTKNYFVGEAIKFIRNRDYVALGRALHPIMDAYAPPHQGYSIYDSRLDIWKHYSELILNPSNFGNFFSSVSAIEVVYNLLNNVSSTSGTFYSDVENVFNIWISGYAER